MAEHSDLISEMAFLEKLNTEERLKLARKRRSQQLKKWSQREKEYSLMNKRKLQEDSDSSSIRKNSGYKVHFVSSVMLLEAATRNDVEEVKRLLMLGVSPDSTNEDGLTALHQCCIDNCEEMMVLLIEFNATVNAKDSEQWTPLHAAATCGHLHLIKILIEKGADLLAVNADGNMPYDICEDEQTLDYIESEMAKRGITQELIDETRAMTESQMLDDMRLLAINGYDLNYKDKQGATPLHIAASNGYLSVVEFLLDNNASTDDCDDDLWQPIHAAACWGHIDVIEYLVQNGADLDAKTKNGETPFDICEDPDLKSRILQLRNEIESKRAVSSTRLRRSHSQNTRTHSIRRTSIREKSQIAKREAIEEAHRIWHEGIDSRKEDEIDGDTQALNDYHSKVTNNDSPIDLNNIDIKLDDNSHQSSLSSYNSTVKNNHKNYNERSVDMSSYQQTMPVNNQKGTKKIDGLSMESYYSNYYNEYHHENNTNSHPTNDGATSDSVKVEIHVTVNTNSNANSNLNFNAPNSAGTLIDLKKQRSEKHRNSLNNIYSDRMKPPGEQSVSLANSSKPSIPGPNMGNHYHQANSTVLVTPITTGAMIANSKPIPEALHFNAPPSPSNVKKKFRGNPSELIGEEDDKNGCCVIS